MRHRTALRAVLALILATMATMLCLTLNPQNAYAVPIPEGGDSGTYWGADWSVSEDGHLVIGNGGEQTMTSTMGPADTVSYPWLAYNDVITSVSFSGTVHGVGNFAAFFDKLYAVTSIDCTGFETGGITDMTFMFAECTLLTDINLGDQFDTSNATGMAYMFAGDPSLTTLDISGMGTSKVTNTMWMFAYDVSLTHIDLGDGFTTASVATMSSMFLDCSALRSINFGRQFDFVGTDAAFPTPEGEGLTGKWVPGPDPRSTVGAETAADLMTKDPELNLWVAQLESDATTQAWEANLEPYKATDEPGDKPTGDDPNASGTTGGQEGPADGGTTGDGNGVETGTTTGDATGRTGAKGDLPQTGVGSSRDAVIRLLAVVTVASGLMSVIMARKASTVDGRLWGEKGDGRNGRHGEKRDDGRK